jgi:hypothetical protein
VHRSLARDHDVRRLDERSGEIELTPKGILTSDTDLESTDDELGMYSKHGATKTRSLSRVSTVLENCPNLEVSVARSVVFI